MGLGQTEAAGAGTIKKALIADRVRAAALRLTASPYIAAWRIAIDVAAWICLALLALHFDSWLVTVPVVFLIGAAPIHDLLVMGHEGTHDLISRNTHINECLSWFSMGIAGISITAHREFHLDHHRHANTSRDPEFILFNRIVPGVPGWAYLVIPVFAQLGVNMYPWVTGRPWSLRLKVVRDLILILGLHAVLFFVASPGCYVMFVLAPMLTGLFAATVVRSITEHHAVGIEDEWVNARSVVTNAAVEFLCSNVNYHLEHHLFPGVPFQKLPAVRQLLNGEYPVHGSFLGRGYLRTASRLLFERDHFARQVRSVVEAENT